MADRITIISNAIALLGKGPITTIASGGDFAAFAENMYEMTISSVLAKDNWRFATALQELSRLVEEPIVDRWEYIFQLPADYLSLIRLYPDTRNFQIYQNKLLYTNLNDLILEYRFKPTESKFPDHFVEFYTYYLASRIALTGGITGDSIKTLSAWESTAYKSALAADGASHPNQSIISAPYITARGAGSGG